MLSTSTSTGIAALSTVTTQLSTGVAGPVRYGTSTESPGTMGSTPHDMYLVPGSGSGPVVLNNVAPGKLSAGSLQAVNGGQIYNMGSNIAAALGGGVEFNQSTGQLSAPNYVIQGRGYSSVGTALQAVDGAISNIGNEVNNLAKVTGQLVEQVGKNRKIAAGGIAGATASSQIRYDDRPGRATLGIGAGYYDGQGALAIGFGGTSDNARWRYNAAVNFAPGVNKFGAGAGISYSW